ncbi:D-glycero-alpha-D-manno-heptose-1,7-bisphosphate 7-phosphatase [Pantanalinema rosaneae CENA516]|uniref:D-glycero-alpha-D-manno-heptose-1,7-bisphosphate 7-phosphatase n=1 Tax=Pantanalinema rosaneae TaxID=1620701 RepID=UPI003D6E63DF
MHRKAVFLDKDGTLIQDVPYNVDPEWIRFTPKAAEGLRLLHQAGYPLIVISNQSGVARGYFAETALVAVEQRLQELFAAIAVPLTGFYYCPHHPDGVVQPYAVDCTCRKPQPGLLKRAAHIHQLSLPRSWFIGDILHDVEAGRAVGCRTILLDNGNETEWQLSPRRLPHHVVNNLWEAARVITAIDNLSFSPVELSPSIALSTIELTHLTTNRPCVTEHD